MFPDFNGHKPIIKKTTEKTKTGYSVNLTKLKYTKLLSQGEVSDKITVTIPSVSAKAKEKLEAAGGKVEGITPTEESK